MQCLILCSEKCFVFNLLQRAVRVLHCRLQCCLSEKCFYLLQLAICVLHLCSILCNLCVACRLQCCLRCRRVESWRGERPVASLNTAPHCITEHLTLNSDHWTLHHTTPCWSLNAQHSTLNTEQAAVVADSQCTAQAAPNTLVFWALGEDFVLTLHGGGWTLLHRWLTNYPSKLNQLLFYK